MKVMKFGGTSVGSVNSILSVKRIVESASAGEPVIVVVSALGGITDKLINTSKMAATGDSAYEGEFREIVYRHVEMIKEVVPAGEGQVALQRQIGELLNELKDIFQGFCVNFQNSLYERNQLIQTSSKSFPDCYGVGYMVFHPLQSVHCLVSSVPSWIPFLSHRLLFERFLYSKTQYFLS